MVLIIDCTSPGTARRGHRRRPSPAACSSDARPRRRGRLFVIGAGAAPGHQQCLLGLVHKLRNDSAICPRLHAGRQGVAGCLGPRFGRPRGAQSFQGDGAVGGVTGARPPRRIREGLEETLTVQRHGLTGSLERTLRTTNIIENLMGSVEGYTRRVKPGGQMIQRWVAAGAGPPRRGRRLDALAPRPVRADVAGREVQQRTGRIPPRTSPRSWAV